MMACRAPSLAASEKNPGSGASPKSHDPPPESVVGKPVGEELSGAAGVGDGSNAALLVAVGKASAVPVGGDGVKVSPAS
jgi:hypothetical protein